MSSILPRKYNNPVVIGMGVLLVAAVVVIVLMMTRSSPSPQTQHVPQQPQPRGAPQAAPKTETYVGTGKPTLVLFYGDWCGHSKAALPEWEKAKAILNGGGQIDAVDFEHKRDPAECADAQANLEGFRGFPDYRFYPEGYPNGSPAAYSGDRSEESLLKFAYTGGKTA